MFSRAILRKDSGAMPGQGSRPAFAGSGIIDTDAYEYACGGTPSAFTTSTRLPSIALATSPIDAFMAIR